MKPRIRQRLLKTKTKKKGKKEKVRTQQQTLGQRKPKVKMALL